MPVGRYQDEAGVWVRDPFRATARYPNRIKMMIRAGSASTCLVRFMVLTSVAVIIMSVTLLVSLAKDPEHHKFRQTGFIDLDTEPDFRSTETAVQRRHPQEEPAQVVRAERRRHTEVRDEDIDMISDDNKAQEAKEDYEEEEKALHHGPDVLRSQLGSVYDGDDTVPEDIEDDEKNKEVEKTYKKEDDEEKDVVDEEEEEEEEKAFHHDSDIQKSQQGQVKDEDDTALVDIEYDEENDEEYNKDEEFSEEEIEEAEETIPPPNTTEVVLEKRLPDCLIIGVRKGGTRPIVHFLSLHPQVVALGPELGFFSSMDNYAKGLEWYKNQMPPVSKDQVLIEKTADYFQNVDAPKRVYDMNPNIKLILILRDPVERMISDYYFLRRYAEKHNVTTYRFMELEYSLEDLLYNSTTGSMKYNHGGLFRSKYIKFLKNWLKYFPLKQIHIIDGDAFAKKNPAIELQYLEHFLGIQPLAKREHFFYSNQKGFWCLRSQGCMGAEKGHKFPKLEPKVETAVREFFRPLNQELYRTIGRDFGWL